MHTIALLGHCLIAASSDRADLARKNVEPKLRPYYRAAGIQYPPVQLFLRVFKDEKKMEVWGGNSSRSSLKQLVRYSILAAAGGPGPKRQSGDRQVPEGWYYIDRFNPASSYHLSLRINYPNQADRVLATSSNPGSDIYIHGNHLSDGCLAMGDTAIEEIYTMARFAKGKVVVFIAPTRKPNRSDPKFGKLWQQLDIINQKFEANHVLPKISIDPSGTYRLK